MVSIKLKLRGLASTRETFTQHLTADFFDTVEPVEVRHADVTATIEVTPAADGAAHVVIDCRGTLVIPCDRCLGDLSHTVDARYEVTIVPRGDAYDDSGDTVLLVPETWQEVDLAPLVRDTVLLTVPMVHSHAEGECDSAMADLLARHRVTELPEADGDAPVDPRWAALRQLKDDNNQE